MAFTASQSFAPNSFSKDISQNSSTDIYIPTTMSSKATCIFLLHNVYIFIHFPHQHYVAQFLFSKTISCRMLKDTEKGTSFRKREDHGSDAEGLML